MSRLRAFLHAALAWLAALFRWRRRTPAIAAGAPPPALTYVAELVDEQPDDLERGRCYLVGEGEHRWLAAFSCPCGCGATVVLNLLSGMRPRWRAEIHVDGTISLMPSIARHVGCRSHFFVRRGGIDWCAPSTDEAEGVRSDG